MTARALIRKLLLPAAPTTACLAAAPAGAAALTGGALAQTGGAAFVAPQVPTAPLAPAPTGKAVLLADGRAVAPLGAPPRVRRAIAAANRIIGKPYRYGGGHGLFSARLDSGYDCSGTVSQALRGGRFLRSPLPSGALMRWGRRGRGRWITVYAHGEHAYAVIAGLRLDTGRRDPDAATPNGPAWNRRMRPSAGYAARHPVGY